MNILELHQRGIIGFLHKKGLVSTSTLTYVEYYKRFKNERSKGAGYRETVRKLSKEFGVSETTIKKAVRLIQEDKKSDVEETNKFSRASSLSSDN